MNPVKLTIRHSVVSVEPEFAAFWSAALEFQRSRALPVWPDYPREIITQEIANGRHFSAFLPDGVLAGCFSITLSDPYIWGGKENNDAVYLHRLCINPAHRGNNLAPSALIWAGGFAAGVKRKLIRMDTWGDNLRLVEYYRACGFRHIESRRLAPHPGLAPNYHNMNVAFFENEI